MVNPVAPLQITTPYGTPGNWQAGYHTGDDYATRGMHHFPVRAARRGRVVSVGGPWGRAYGLTVVILGPKGRIQMGYAHLSEAYVKVGQQVRAGEVIGFTGVTGRTTGEHLHYEERRPPFRYANHRRPRFNRR